KRGRGHRPRVNDPNQFNGAATDASNRDNSGHHTNEAQPKPHQQTAAERNRSKDQEPRHKAPRTEPDIPEQAQPQPAPPERSNLRRSKAGKPDQRLRRYQPKSVAVRTKRYRPKRTPLKVWISFSSSSCPDKSKSRAKPDLDESEEVKEPARPEHGGR